MFKNVSEHKQNTEDASTGDIKSEGSKTGSPEKPYSETHQGASQEESLNDNSVTQGESCLNNTIDTSDTIQDQTTNNSEGTFQDEPDKNQLEFNQREDNDKQKRQNKSKQTETTTDKSIPSTEQSTESQELRTKDNSLDKTTEEGNEDIPLPSASYLERENRELKEKVTASENKIKQLQDKVHELEKDKEKEKSLEKCLQDMKQEIQDMTQELTHKDNGILDLRKPVEELKQINKDQEHVEIRHKVSGPQVHFKPKPVTFKQKEDHATENLEFFKTEYSKLVEEFKGLQSDLSQEKLRCDKLLHQNIFLKSKLDEHSELQKGVSNYYSF